MLHLSEQQIALCDDAAKIEESFSDCGEADKHLIDAATEAGFLRKTSSRKTPYIFTEAGAIAVELWRDHQTPNPLAEENARLRQTLAAERKKVIEECAKRLDIHVARLRDRAVQVRATEMAARLLNTAAEIEAIADGVRFSLAATEG